MKEQVNEALVEEENENSIDLQADQNTGLNPALHVDESLTSAATHSLIPISILLGERLMFLWMIYGGKNDLWIFLTITAIANTVYYAVYTKCVKTKHKAALYTAFKLSRTPSISIFLIMFLA